jgi:glycosyltransferase involved in cell wall biosynthesis
MRILFIVPYAPNLIRSRSYNLIRNLTADGHQVTVMTLWENKSEQNDVQALKSNCFEIYSSHLSKWRSLWNCIVALPTQTPLQGVYCWQPKLDQLIKESVIDSYGKPRFDVIHVEHLRGARYALSLNKYLGTLNVHLPIVWDSVDCISLLIRKASRKGRISPGRLLTIFDLNRTEKYEGFLITYFDHVLVTSPIDRQAIISLAPKQENLPTVTVFSHGVDLGYFQPDINAQRDTASIVVSGKMSYHANIAMVNYLCKDIMPHIWSQHPETILYVVGKDPPREIQALGQNRQIIVTGTVPDIRSYLRRATVAVTPLVYGVGIQNKALEAMACATPVVATPQVLTALHACPGQDLLVAEHPVDFAKQVIHLIEDPHRARSIGQAGYQYVKTHHDWANLTLKLENIYTNIITNGQ